jgi:hypothetical protein
MAGLVARCVRALESVGFAPDAGLTDGVPFSPMVTLFTQIFRKTHGQVQFTPGAELLGDRAHGFSLEMGDLTLYQAMCMNSPAYKLPANFPWPEAVDFLQYCYLQRTVPSSLSLAWNIVHNVSENHIRFASTIHIARSARQFFAEMMSGSREAAVTSLIQMVVISDCFQGFPSYAKVLYC